MSNPSVPSGQSLLDLASNVLKLYTETYREGVAAGALAAANNGTPLPPNATTQQLLDFIGGDIQSYIPSQSKSIFIQQLLTFLQKNSVLIGSTALSGTIAANDLAQATITVSGAEPGDFVDFSFSSILAVTPYLITPVVSASNTVTIGILNLSPLLPMNLNGKTAYVRVTKRA
jgi:hypothetical protein